MYRYYDKMAIGLGAVLMLSGVGGVLGGTYLMAVALMGAGAASMAYSRQLKAQADKRQLLEESPITASRPRLEDKQIVKRITQAKFDPLNFQLKDLDKGSLMDYNTETYEIEDLRYLYWLEADGQDRHQISKSGKFSIDNEEYTIQVHQDRPNPLVPLTKEVNAFMIDPKMQTYINLKEFDPPPVLNFKGQAFYREARKRGYSIEKKYMTYSDFQVIEYYSESKKEIIRLTYFGEKQITAEVGTMEDETKFSNILPAPDDDNLLITD